MKLEKYITFLVKCTELQSITMKKHFKDILLYKSALEKNKKKYLSKTKQYNSITKIK